MWVIAVILMGVNIYFIIDIVVSYTYHDCLKLRAIVHRCVREIVVASPNQNHLLTPMHCCYLGHPWTSVEARGG